jgi:cyclic beta-1,2-glucan synthetase
MAEFWVNKLYQKSEENPRDLVMVIADMAKSKPPLNSAFVAEFSRRLQWKGPSLNLALNWIEQNLSENGESVSSMVLSENQKKAADQVSMSNSITSLRFLSKIDWREFVETLSIIEQILRTDHQGTYSNMDFETRNRYRHVVEDIAKNSPLSEKEVAELTIRLTQESLNPINIRKRENCMLVIFCSTKALNNSSKEPDTNFQYTPTSCCG